MGRLHQAWDRILVTLVTSLSSAGAMAGTLVKQAVEANSMETSPDKSKSVKSTNYRSTHVWRIEPPRFNLTVTTGKDETQYIFNSRTLYVCGQLDESQMKIIANAAAGHAKAFDRYRKGVCQVVPSNFMARFFLSPMLAVESVEAADGLNLTLSMQDYSVRTTEATSHADHACSGYKRHFVLEKASPTVGVKPRRSTIDEHSCASDGPVWRASMWPEVAKIVMRQPGGRSMLKQLKADAAALPGLQLQGEVRQDRVFSQGTQTQTKFKLTTTTIGAAEFEPALFLPPVGYELFSPESVDLSSLATSGDKAAGKSSIGQKNEDVIDMVRSAFFCALAGPLGCVAD